MVDDSGEGGTQFSHRVLWSSFLPGELIDRRFCIHTLACLAFVREVKEQSEESALVWDGGTRTSFGMYNIFSHKPLSEFTPGSDGGKTTVDLLQGFRAKGFGSHWGSGRGMGSIGDGIVEFLQGPVIHNIDSTTTGPPLLEQWACRVILRNDTRKHKAFLRQQQVGLTLGIRKDFGNCRLGELGGGIPMNVGCGARLSGIPKVLIRNWASTGVTWGRLFQLFRWVSARRHWYIKSGNNWWWGLRAWPYTRARNSRPGCCNLNSRHHGRLTPSMGCCRVVLCFRQWWSEWFGRGPCGVWCGSGWSWNWDRVTGWQSGLCSWGSKLIKEITNCLDCSWIELLWVMFELVLGTKIGIRTLPFEMIVTTTAFWEIQHFEGLGCGSATLLKDLLEGGPCHLVWGGTPVVLETLGKRRIFMVHLGSLLLAAWTWTGLYHVWHSFLWVLSCFGQLYFWYRPTLLRRRWPSEIRRLAPLWGIFWCGVPPRPVFILVV